MAPEERRLRAERLREIIASRDPGDWIDEQLTDIRAKAGGRSPVG
jgi:trehalose 6-phosphate synthase